MPAPKKDMKSFLNEFFNPPKFSKTSEEKGVGKKVIKKKVKKKTPVLSPLQVNKLQTLKYYFFKINNLSKTK